MFPKWPTLNIHRSSCITKSKKIYFYFKKNEQSDMHSLFHDVFFRFQSVFKTSKTDAWICGGFARNGIFFSVSQTLHSGET